MTRATETESGADAGRTPPFRRILVVCDLSQDDADTLRLAAGLADACGADLAALAVVDLASGMERLSRFASVSPEEIERRHLEACRQRLIERVGAAVSSREVAAEVRVGKPFLEIIRYALTHGHDLVVKQAEELHGLHRYLFGSTDQHLLRKCPCPVWLVRPDARRPAGTVLAAVDVDAFSAGEPATQAGLNRRIVETAAEIAAFDGATLHILHVWDAPGEGLVRLWADAPGADSAVRRYVSEIETERRQALEDLVAAARTWLGPATVQRIGLVHHLEQGAPGTAIPDRARALRADILVMGTLSRTGVPGFIIGNTAEDVLNGVGCSVVTVKPPGYVSPVAAGW